MKGLSMHNAIAHWVLVVGGINWGLVGIGHFFGANWNAVNLLAGSIPYVEPVIYIIVGIAAVIAAFGGCRCTSCSVSGGQAM